MRTTINIDDDLLAEAMRLTGITEKTALVRAGLEALVSWEASKRLARLGGSAPDIEPIPRRRSTKVRNIGD
ncbi:MAG: type II toxin-antitoxin system VapB family antitoxin [Acidobacteriota bacterium]|jgi:Arc/MetJ family transcription regulator